MIKKSIFLLVACLFGTGAICAVAQDEPSNYEPIVYSLDDGRFIHDWLVCSPFSIDLIANATEQLGKTPPRSRDVRKERALDFDFLQEHGGEVDIKPKPGMKHTIIGADSEWAIYHSPQNLLDFKAVFGEKEWVVTYAYAEVVLPEATTAWLAIGSDDCVKVWLNGELVDNYRGGRQARPGDDMMKVDVKQGVNRILCKVTNMELDWGLFVRLMADDRVSQMTKINSQMNQIPTEAYTQLALIVGGVAAVTLLMLIMLMFLSKSRARF
ncbi:MAG: hypothetical protein GC154_00645 [bacterium]|nr:hypothetical protein [bacterium]